MTTPSLDNMSVEHYRKQAKALLQAYRNADAAAIQRVRNHHPEFAGMPIEYLASSKFQLADAQLVIAREHGFPSWPRLKGHLDGEALARDNQSLADDTAALDTLIASYRSALMAGVPADRSSLNSAFEIVTRRLRHKSSIDRVMIHQIRALCQWQDDGTTYLKALDRHLHEQLAPDDELWARAETVIALAIMGRKSERRAAETVQRHRDMIAWASKSLPMDRLCTPMLWGMTIAKCWLKTDGGGDEWLRRSDAVLIMCPTTAENRRDRFEVIRNRAIVQSLMDRNGDALRTLEKASGVAGEDRGWSDLHFMQVRAAAEALSFHRKRDDEEGVQRAVQNASQALSDLRAQCGDGGNYPAACDCLGHALFHIRRYDEAIPLLRQAIGLPEQSLNPWGLTVLAAATWATTRNRETTLSLLGRAASVSRTNSYVDITQLSEFATILDDPEFLEAIAR